MNKQETEALIRLIEQNTKFANEKLEWIGNFLTTHPMLNTIQPTPSTPTQPIVHPVVQEIVDDRPPWEKPKPIDILPTKKKRSFKRLILICLGVVIVIIFFQYGIPWITYFSGR